MVSSNLMPGGVSISSVIPLRGFLLLYSVGWWWVELGCATKGVTISFKGDLRAPSESWFAHLLPFLVPLRWSDPQMEGDSGAAELRGMVWMCNGRGSLGEHVVQ